MKTFQILELLKVQLRLIILNNMVANAKKFIGDAKINKPSHLEKVVIETCQYLENIDNITLQDTEKWISSLQYHEDVIDPFDLLDLDNSEFELK